MTQSWHGLNWTTCERQTSVSVLNSIWTGSHQYFIICPAPPRLFFHFLVSCHTAEFKSATSWRAYWDHMLFLTNTHNKKGNLRWWFLSVAVPASFPSKAGYMSQQVVGKKKSPQVAHLSSFILPVHIRKVKMIFNTKRLLTKLHFTIYTFCDGKR